MGCFHLALLAIQVLAVFGTGSPYIRVGRDTYSAIEGSNVQIEIEIIQDLGSIVGDVDVTFTNAQTLETQSFTLPNTSIAGEIVTVEYDVSDNSNLNGPTTHEITLNSMEVTPDPARQTASIQIVDNEVVFVSIIETVLNVSESEPTVEVCLELTNATAELLRPLVFYIFSVDGTASSDTDFDAVHQIISLPVGSVQGDTLCYNVTITQDIFVEMNEAFTIHYKLVDQNAWFLGSIYAIINIFDNDEVVIGFNQTAYTVGEEDGNVHVCLEITNVEAPTQNELSVALSTTDGAAIGGEDYTPLDNFLVTFDVGSTNGSQACAYIAIEDDDAFESDEYFDVTVSADAEDNIIIDPQSTVTVTIDDDEEVSLSFAEESYTVDEDAGFVTFCLELSGVSYPTQTLIVVQVDSAEDGADSGDFEAFSESLTFPISSEDGSQVCDNVTITDNSAFEKTENFTLSATSSTDRVNVIMGSATIDIIDDDGVYFEFTLERYYVSEGVGIFADMICLELGGVVESTQSEIWATFSTVNDGATAGADFDVVSMLIASFPVGSNNGTLLCLNVTITNDFAFEKDEYFFVEVEPEAGVAILENRATVIIQDDDEVSLSFAQEEYMVDEDDGYVMVCLVLGGVTDSTQSQIWVNVLSVDGDATVGDDDYEEVNAMLYFDVDSDNGDMVCLNVTINDDMAFEKVENFALEVVSELNVIIEDNNTMIIIADDDVVYLSFVQDEYTVGEMDEVVYVCVELSEVGQDTQDQIWVNITSQEDSAIAGDDFEMVEAMLYFDVGSGNGDRVCTNVTILDNTAFEKDEYFFLQVTSEMNVVIHDNTSTVHIVDDEVVNVAFAQDSYTANEDDMYVPFCLVLTGVVEATQSPIWVNVTSQNGDALAGTDFYEVNAGLSFPADSGNGTEVCYNVSIINNMAFEKTEDFTLHIIFVETDNVIATVNYTRIYVVDDDEVYLSFTEDQYMVEEDAGYAMVCLELSNVTEPTQSQIWVNVSSADGDATIADLDYEAVDSMLYFDIGSVDGEELCLNVTITDNQAFEKEENFSLHFMSEPNVISHSMYTRVIIADDEEVSVSFAQVSYTTPEEELYFTFCLVLSGVVEATQSPVWVDVTSGNGSAEAGSDFDEVNAGLSFPDGSENLSEVCANVTIIDNLAFEDTESFTLHIASMEAGVSILSPVYSTISITDNDDVTVLLPQDMLVVLEGSGLPAMVCVVLSDALAPTEAEIVTFVSSMNGTALAGADYLPITDASVTLGIGSENGDEACVNITIVDNGAHEVDEDFSVISDVGNLTVLIEDEDVVNVNFTQDAYEVQENAGLVPVCVVLTEAIEPIEGPIPVTFTTEDGTALDTLDYGAINTTLMFASLSDNGDMLCVNVTISDDSSYEIREVFRIHVVIHFFGWRIRVRIYVYVYIIDNDPISLEFVPEGYFVDEDASSLEVCALVADAPEPTQAPFSVNFGSQDLTATSGMDYITVAETLVVSSGASNGDQVCVDVTVLDDGLSEPSELFLTTLSLSDADGDIPDSERSVEVLIVDDELCPTIEEITVDFCAEDANLNGNLQCVVDGADAEPTCFEPAELCDGSSLCVLGEDEEDPLMCSADPPTFQCDDGSTVLLDMLCDGNADCSSGDDETADFCANKCLLPYYGGCSLTRKCISAPFGTSCGDCLEGFIEVTPGEPCTPIATFQFTAEVFNASEVEGSVEVCVMLTSVNPSLTPITTPITVTVEAEPDTADSDDFTQISSTVSLDSSNAQDCVTFDIVNDILVEPIESFSVSMVIPDGDEFVLGDIDTAVVEITSEDLPEGVFEFTAASFSVTEDGGMAVVSVGLVDGNDALTSEIQISLVTDVEGSDANVDSDFTTSAVTLTFGVGLAGGDSLDFFIPIIDDEAFEDIESILVEATVLGNQGRFSGNEITADTTVNIEDDDFIFNGDTPTTNGNTISISFSVNELVTQAICQLRSATVDCTGGSASFTTSRRSRAPLTITATLVSGNTRTLVREVKTDNDRCDEQLINRGVSIDGNDVTVEFEGTGPDASGNIVDFTCTLDGGTSEACTSPYMATLASGSHELVILPVATPGCERRISRQVDFNIA